MSIVGMVCAPDVYVRLLSASAFVRGVESVPNLSGVRIVEDSRMESGRYDTYTDHAEWRLRVERIRLFSVAAAMHPKEASHG